MSSAPHATGHGKKFSQRDFPVLGVGLRYHPSFRNDVLDLRHEFDFLEIDADNYLDATRQEDAELDFLAGNFCVVPHACGLSLGSAEGLDFRYVRRLAQLIRRLNPPWWSEHIGFCMAGSVRLRRPSPLPRTPASLEALVDNTRRLRDSIDTPFLLENTSNVVDLPGAVMTEIEFLTEALWSADCGLLLDVASLHACAVNHSLDTSRIIHQLPLHRVVQLHVGGGHWDNGLFVDSHTSPVCDGAWRIVDEIVERTPVAALAIERERNLPPLEEIALELRQAKSVFRRHSRWA